MHIGNPPNRYDIAVDLGNLNRIIEYEPKDLTIVVEAGLVISDLQAHVARYGQRLAYDPPMPNLATIGGSLASNAVGPMITSFGGVRDMTIGLKVVEADGVITKSGGRVVKNVQGFDLVRLHIGAFGTLAVIAEVAFKLFPLPMHNQTVVAWFDSLDWAKEASMQLFNGRFVPEYITMKTGQTARDLSNDLGANFDATDDVYFLATRVSGNSSAVHRQVENVTSTFGASMANGFELVDDTLTIPEFEPATGDKSNAVLCRITLKPSAAFDFVSKLQKTQPATGLDLEISVHVGTGTVMVLWSNGTATTEQTIKAVKLSVETAHICGGKALVELCPELVKKQVSVWNENGRPLEIMKALKEQFDPSYTLNPGRFAGRI